METLVVVPQHRNQYYSRNSSHVHERFGSPSGGFRDINCRFQARGGILTTPTKYCDFSNMAEKTPSPKPQKPVSKQVSSYSEGENIKRNVKSNAIPITFKASNLEKSFSDDFSYSELWAGPAYSNSPPPSSLPIPRFSLRQKRSVSLELPVRDLGIKIHPVAKSAPTSPRGGLCPSPNSFMRSTASAIKDIAATKDLRRILNIGDCLYNIAYTWSIESPVL